MIIFLGALGPVISTAIGLGVPIALMYNHLHTVTHFSRKTVFRKALLICILTVLMAIPVAVFYWLFQFVLSPTSRMGSVIYLVIGGGLGIGVYGVLALVTRMADQLLGARATSLVLNYILIKSKPSHVAWFFSFQPFLKKEYNRGEKMKSF